MRRRGFTDETIVGPPDRLRGRRLGDAQSRADRQARLHRARSSRRRDSCPSRQGRRGVYDRFRGRIIFPIRDASGNATGLGGRIVGAASERGEATRDAGPKYLNSPATLLFDKSRTLYLIDRAKSAIRKQGVAVLVEGNTDALMAHQQGFENVVGTLGTALTAGADRAGDAVCAADRARVRRRRGGAGRGHVRRHGALRARRRDRAQRPQRPADGRRRRPAARRQGPRRGDARRRRRLADGHRGAAADRRVPDRHVRAAARSAHTRRPREARGRGDADDPARHQPNPARRLPAAAGSPEWRGGTRPAGGAAPAGADRQSGRSAVRRRTSEARSTSRPSCPARTRWIPRPSARTLEPIEASLLRVLLRAAVHPRGAHRPGHGRVVRDHSGARAVAPDRRDACGRLRSGSVRRIARPDAGGRGADPVCAHGPTAGRRRRAQAVGRAEPARPGAQQDHERLEFKRAEMSEAEAAADNEAAERLRREVLELQTQRLDLDRRREQTTVLNQRRNRTTAATAAAP